MAAELDYHNGNAQVFSVRETPWHREGIVLQGAPSYDEALSLLHFDYPLEKRPYFSPSGDLENPAWEESGDAFYIWRADKGVKLGNVGGDYEVVTNTQAFEPLKPLVDSGVLTLETGGVLREGADAWLCGRWAIDKFGTEARKLFEDPTEPLLPYATSMANHSGRRGIFIGEVCIRPVCANTVSMAETDRRSRWETVFHNKGAQEKLVEAAERVFGNVIQRFEELAAQYRLLKGVMLARHEFESMVLDVVAPDPRKNPKFNPEAKLAETVLARAERKRAEVSRLWFEGKGHDGTPSAWMALNACVEALDHNQELWPTRAGSYRTASLLTGKLGELKQQVTNRLVRHCEKVLSV